MAMLRITLSRKLLNLISKRADKFGVKATEYARSLLIKDAKEGDL